jgi:alpha-amylase/alpha-mannosidase (GH57 family)
MAATLEQYPDIHATFNLTPSLIRQIDDFEAGAKDLYWTTALVPADQLSEDQKQFLLDRFFDTNRKIIARFPRYQELLDKRDGPDPSGTFTIQDYRDLQVLFNLAWVDPDWLAQEPLSALAAKGENFEEADKEILFREHSRLISEVIPIHKKLQDSGQIEVTMTPFAHPILPLLVSTKLALQALPDLTLPSKSFIYGQDAIAQVELGAELYQDHFGQPPRGMWPAEGAVAEEIVSMVSNAGIRWMASDEGVLANSLGMSSFTRDAGEVVNEADQLYRPYTVQGTQGEPVVMVFRDVVISDKVGFTYSGVPGSQAAGDFIDRVHSIRQRLIDQGVQGPHLVSVILDGENAWEYYDNDGKEFLHSLYQGLSQDPLIETVTPSEFLALAPNFPSIDKLWAGSWINHDFSTWIGEEEENRAWDYLATAREMLQEYENGERQASPQDLESARTQMYIAEGSDWFWWFGADQNSEDDASFDRQFRETLQRVYELLGEDPPTLLETPIIPQEPVEPQVSATGLISPTVDGLVNVGEWENAGVYRTDEKQPGGVGPYFDSLAYGFDPDNMYLKIEPQSETAAVEGNTQLRIYLGTPGGDSANYFTLDQALLGFPAQWMGVVDLVDGGLVNATLFSAQGEEVWNETGPLDTIAQGGGAEQLSGVIEMSLSLSVLGKLSAGDRINLRAVLVQVGGSGEERTHRDLDVLPAGGPAELPVPDLGKSVVFLDISDPEGDDHGPGGYSYPTDGVFTPGVYDILQFQVGFDDEQVIFRFVIRGEVANPWGSPNGLSVQTFDVYIDTDGPSSGGRGLLPGRNLSLQDGFAWDFAITAEGWEPGIFTPTDQGPEEIAGSSQFVILTDPGLSEVTIRVPKAILGETPQDWRYAGMVLSQDGFPSSGVMRVRDVQVQAEQWRIGGGLEGAPNQTRVMDLVWPDAGAQEGWLSDFTPVDQPQSELDEGDFPSVPMLEVE